MRTDADNSFNKSKFNCFEKTISRKAQAAAQKAENEGKTSADWTKTEEEETPEP